MRRIFALFLLIGLPLLASCLTLNPTPAPEPAAPSQTPPPTQTIVWFPPSATPTLIAIPTYTGTPEMKPGIGTLIFADDFTDSSLWDTVDSLQASVTVKDNRLTLAVESGTSVSTLRRDATLTDFYAEITAHIGLCRGNDVYGLLLRSTGKSFYRYSLSCNGLIQAERIKDSVRLLLLEPIASGDAPPGPPGEVKIGIWAVGGEMRFFLNDRFQFTLIEKTIPGGAFGVFVRSNGDTPVTIAFSDLKVYEVEYTAPTITPQP
jgi:hypothetical protein